MPHSKLRLKFDRPILAPAQFHPTKIWTEKGYIYRYDPQQRVCKRSPIDSNSLTGTMFFAVTPVVRRTAPAKPKPKPTLTYRLGLSSLWAVLIIAAMVFIYPLWPEAVY